MNEQDQIKLMRGLCQCFEEAYADDTLKSIKVKCACGTVCVNRLTPLRTYTYNGVVRVISCNCIFVNDEIISMITWLLKNYEPLSKFIVEVSKRGILDYGKENTPSDQGRGGQGNQEGEGGQTTTDGGKEVLE